MSHKDNIVKWWTVCKCDQMYSLMLPFNYTREKANDAFYEKHHVTLFPTRCDKCRQE